MQNANPITKNVKAAIKSETTVTQLPNETGEDVIQTIKRDTAITKQTTPMANETNLGISSSLNQNRILSLQNNHNIRILPQYRIKSSPAQAPACKDCPRRSLATKNPPQKTDFILFISFQKRQRV